MLRIISTAVVDPEEERRDPGPSSVFGKTKIPHTFNNNGYYMTNSYRPDLKIFDWLRASL